MIANLLLNEMKGAKYQVKLFLICWVLKFHEDPLDEGRVKELAKIFSVSERVVRDALKYLVKHEYLIKVAYKDCKGRRQNRFDLGEPIKELISKKPRIQRASYQTDIVEYVLSPTCDHIVVSSKEDTEDTVTINNFRLDLTVDCKFVLAVLLLLGDSRGVVKGYGLSDFSKILCMSVAQIKPRLNELVKKGYIKNVVTGMTGKALFGLKPSIYFLDLKHESLGDKKARGPVIQLPQNISERLVVEAVDLFQHKRLEHWPNVRPGIFEPDEIGVLSAFFKDPTNKEVKYLQAYLTELAAYILSSCWNQLAEANAVYDELHLEIENELLPASFLKEQKQTGFPLIEHNKLFSRLIFEISLNVAKAVRNKMDENMEHDFEKMNFIIERTFKQTENPRFRLELCSLICFFKKE
ncbi:hypothetical protein [Shewanella psychrotolerans]|uniref:hypothetical protein n=1 Tax=Shewanella psychrotolerans TaxID=2864206 RepID=UPI001C658EA0|nr:hypothetical protein [Shewanella psychrotolerans]QYK01730.1 hypothetical protein K0I62_01710 [Shewanella psychrotolerans]